MKNKAFFIVNLTLLGVAGIILFTTIFDFKVSIYGNDADPDLHLLLNKKGQYFVEMAPFLLGLFTFFFIPIWLVSIFFDFNQKRTYHWETRSILLFLLYGVIAFVTSALIVFTLLSLGMHQGLAYVVFNWSTIVQATIFQKHLERVFFVLDLCI
jgi:hypothetical protein